MSAASPKVSIIIATYQPGAGIERVINSLDEQTMPQDEFEVIFVDDGSPDDTFARLEDLAAERPNVRAFRMENSGWPSRPRNLGIRESRGEYLMFMDHDDSLFPDGLRRAYEYAVETGADVLSPKESKTNDKWWGMSSLREGNLPNIAGGEGILHLLPLVPHKFYRRILFMEHDIRFPEGGRVLWEDQFINIDAYRHARVVSVLADTPVYLWHASDTNTSHTFDPARVDFWDRLELLMAHIDKVLKTPEHRDARRLLLEMQLRVRVIDRMVRLLSREETLASTRALRRARKLLRRYGRGDVLATLPRKHQIQAQLLRKGRRDLLVAMHEQDLAGDTNVSVTSAEWKGGVLEFEIETLFAPKSAERPVLRRDGDRVVLALPDAVSARVAGRLLDVTTSADQMTVELVVRSRRGYVTWSVPSTVTSSDFVDGPKGLSLRVLSSARLDPNAVAVGRPLADNVWDLFAETDWLGMMRRRPVEYKGAAAPAVVADRAVIAYENSSHALSVDTAGWLRSLASDAAPEPGAAGTTSAVKVALSRLSTDRDLRYTVPPIVGVPEDAELASVPRWDAENIAESAVPLVAEVVVEGGSAALVGSFMAAPGRYRLFARREQAFHATRHSLAVGEDRVVQWQVQ